MVCQLRFYFPLLPRAANCTLMSSCFFACSVLDDTGGQDGLRRDGRPSFATCSIDQHQSATTNDAGSSTPRTHRGHLLTAEGAGSWVYSYCSLLRCRTEPLLTFCPVKLGFRDPHAM